MKSFWSWLAIKIVSNLSKENLNKFVFDDFPQRVSQCVTAYYTVAPTDVLLVNVPETLARNEVDVFTAELKKAIPNNRFIIVATDSPIKIVRFE